MAREVAAVFRAPGLAESKKRLAEITARWHKELPEAVNVLERGFTAATQFYAFPEPHWARLRTTNSLERLHTEIKRRIRSAGAFPDRASALRLITAVALRTTAVWSETSLPGISRFSNRRRSPRQPNRSIEELPLTFTHNSGLDPYKAGRSQSAGVRWDSAEGYRNGYGQPRRLAMSSGTIMLRRPRVRGVEERFESRVLPLFARRTKELGALLPELYLHGLAEGDFELAMRGLLGEGAPLSKSSIRRLRAGWTAEFEEWSKRSLADREVVYVWADGIYVKAGLERDKAALLVVLGAMRDGTKEVLALRSGYRESVESWSEVLRDLKARGIEAPRLLMADGNAAIWGAVRQVWPEAGEQRCWNHKMRNVLGPAAAAGAERGEGSSQGRGLRTEPVRGCEGPRSVRQALQAVVSEGGGRTRGRLGADGGVSTTSPRIAGSIYARRNVVESPFAALRLRTTAAKRFKRVESATALIWKLLLVAEKRFRRLDAPHLLKDVSEGRKFEDGKTRLNPTAEECRLIRLHTY